MSFSLSCLKTFYINKYRTHLVMLTVSIFTLLLCQYFKINIEYKLFSFNFLFTVLSTIFSYLCYNSISKVNLVDYDFKDIYFILTNFSLVRINDFLVLFNIGFYIVSLFISLFIIN